MKEELDKDQARKDIEFMANNLKEAVTHLSKVYEKLNEIYTEIQ